MTYFKTILAVFLLTIIFGLKMDGLVCAEDVNELKIQRDEIERKINDLNALVEEKKNQAVNLENQLAIFDAKIEQLELQIKDTEMLIWQKEEEINIINQEIGRQQRMLEYQKEILDESIQMLYEHRDQSLLMILLSSKNFSDFEKQVTYVESIKEQVRITIAEINRIKNSLEKQRVSLKDEKNELEILKEKKDAEQFSLENQRQAKNLLLEQTKGEEEEFQKQLEQAVNEENSITAEIDKFIEEAKKKLEEKYPNLEGGEGFGFPLSGLNRIGVIGGDYMDPYYGFGFPHSGVDLYAAQGTPVYASASGMVLLAYDSGGSGLSYIAIQHPNGFLTKYLHMTEIWVASGQVINRGEVIGLSGGAVGTRGAGYFTTGPHLHFEINDQNGNSVNPHDFMDIVPAY